MKFVKNVWYVAAMASEVRAEPLARRLLDVPVVMFRGSDDKAHALLDICPHRAVPLHMGTVVGNRIRCVYHGLEFDGDGVCRHNPHIAGPPERLCAQAFPLVERYGLFWIWLGDRSAADPALIPDYEKFEQPDKYPVGHGYTWVEADYRLMIDNLFDLSHAEYIHPETVGIVGAHRVAQHKVTKGDSWVRIQFNVPDMRPAAIWRAAWRKSEHMDQHAHMIWTGGGSCYLDLCITPPGQAVSEGWNLPFLHLLTPETERSTHYFWTFARDFEIDTPGLTEAIAAASAKAFADEDKPILDALQRTIASDDSVRLRNFTVGDSASMHIRRLLKAQVEHEAGGTSLSSRSDDEGTMEMGGEH